MVSTAELIERTETALAYFEDGARETGLDRLRQILTEIDTTYRPIVNLETGHEAMAVGSALVEGYTTLEPAVDGTWRAPDGTAWVGCSDSVWRRTS